MPGQTTPLNLADADPEGRPTAMPTTLPPAVSAATDPAKHIPSIPATQLPTLPTSADTPIKSPKAVSTGCDAATKDTINVELLKLKLQLAKAQSANASAKHDAAVSKTLVVPTAKKMSLTFQREAQAAKKVVELLPKALNASPIKVTRTYPRTHKHTTHTNLRLFL